MAGIKKLARRNFIGAGVFSKNRSDRTIFWRLAMLWTIAIILIIMWAAGFLAFHVAGGLIHLLLVVALVLAVFRLISGRRVL